MSNNGNKAGNFGGYCGIVLLAIRDFVNMLDNLLDGMLSIMTFGSLKDFPDLLSWFLGLSILIFVVFLIGAWIYKIGRAAWRTSENIFEK